MAARTIAPYTEFKKFFSSGVFYIVVGGIFLFTSYVQIGEPGSHPSFIFLLAILGVAIVLYGTGTQAIGKSNTGTTNVAIAGGAGVLAIVLGFGVVQFNEAIQKVFSSAEYYAVIRLVPDNRSANLDDFVIGARLPNSQPLHLWKSDQEVQILVPVSNSDKLTELTVIARRRAPGDASPSIFSQDYEIIWADASFTSSRHGLENLTQGKVSAPSETSNNVRFRIDDQLIVTPAETVVSPEGDEPPIRILAQ